MKPLKLAFRVDGSPASGMGHIMRCLSLAKEFRKNGDQALFISKEPVGIAKITNEGFPSVSFKGDELKAIIRISAIKNLDILIVDSYKVNRDYLYALKPHIPLLIYLDDLNQFENPAEIIINGNYAAERLGYSEPAFGCLQLLGVQYNLIREEFKNLPRPAVKPKIERVLITMGGSDPPNFTGRLITTLRQDVAFDKIALEVVVGGGNQHYEQILELSRSYPRVVVHYNTQHLSKLMLQADVALSAGGSTLYELCACGTPTIGIKIAENQNHVLSELARDGYLINLGWYRDLDMNSFKNAIKMYNYAKRRETAAKMRQLIDSKGTGRVRKKIVEFWLDKRYMDNKLKL